MGIVPLPGITVKAKAIAVATNTVLFELEDPKDSEYFVKVLNEDGILHFRVGGPDDSGSTAQKPAGS